VVVKKVCAPCKGEGITHRTRRVQVTFPAGIDAGQRLRVPGQGVAGPRGVESGDLYVEIDVEEHPQFERDGVDLVTRIHVSYPDATLGGEVLVPLLDEAAEPVKLPISPGTASGAVFSVKGQGVPRLDGRGRGSLMVVVQVDVPTSLTPRARELLAELRSELSPPTERDAPTRVASA